MDLSSKVLGKTVVERLRETRELPVLKIGKDVFTRGELATVECFNFAAAANLTRILKDELVIRDTKALFETVGPLDLALPRLGAVSLAVLGAAFEAKGLGAGAPLEAWMKLHTPGDAQMVTFLSIKHRKDRPVDKTADGKRVSTRFTARDRKAK